MNAVPATLGLGPDQVEVVLRTAGRAPSLHNSQPWSFRIRPHTIELHCDPQRRLPAADPDGTEQRLGCGAALFNLRLALHHYGVRPLVTLLPDRYRPNLLAVIRHGGYKSATPELDRLLRAVPARRTNRRPFSDTPVPTAQRRALRRAALDEGLWLQIVEDPEQRAGVRHLATEAHAAQQADPAFREEFRRWLGGPPDRHDGIPLSAAGPVPDSPDSWVLRDFSGISANGTRGEATRKDFEAEPLIAVLISHLPGAAADVQAGQALQRVLLTATAHGLAASFLSQVIEVPGTREDLRRLVGSTRPPHAVLRIGYGWPVPATPRRPVEDLIAPAPSPAG